MKRNSIIGLGVALCIPVLVWPLVQQTSTPENAPLLYSSIFAEAQGGARDGGREGEREGRPPGGPGREFRRSEKMQLGRFVREIGDIEKAKKTPLNKKQAQKIVATIAPWRKKASMSDADAKKLYAALRDTLTAEQKKVLDQRPSFGGGGPRGEGGPRGDRPDGPPRGERPNGPPPGGPRGEGGARGPGGPRGGDFKPPTEAEMKKMQEGMKKMGEFMKTFNPFYPVTAYKQVKALPKPMQEGMERRYKEMNTVLYQLSVKK